MIFGLGGNLSGGKTVTAVRFAHDKLKEGKKVIANIKLTDKFAPEDAEVYFMSNADLVYFLKKNFENQDKLREMFFNSVLLLDEVGNLINARRSSTALNEIVVNFFMMAGKLDCDVVFTFQVKESQVDKILREVCNVYANCYRITADGRPLIFENRTTKEKVNICVIFEFNFDILGVQYNQVIYDPEPYYGMYDTREITLLDRASYMRGGSRDLRKDF